MAAPVAAMAAPVAGNIVDLWPVAAIATHLCPYEAQYILHTYIPIVDTHRCIPTSTCDENTSHDKNKPSTILMNESFHTASVKRQTTNVFQQQILKVFYDK